MLLVGVNSGSSGWLWFGDGVVVVGESTTKVKVVNGVMAGCGGIGSGNLIAEAV